MTVRIIFPDRIVELGGESTDVKPTLEEDQVMSSYYAFDTKVLYLWDGVAWR